MTVDLVDVRDYGFRVEPHYYKQKWSSDPRILGRRTAVESLVRVRERLQEKNSGLDLLVYDFFRTLTTQVNMIEGFSRLLTSMNPNMTEAELAEQIDLYTSKPDPDHLITRLDCHRNGGAVDLTIIRSDGTELDMGSPFDSLSLRSWRNYYHNLKDSSPWSEVIAGNRDLLASVMEPEGWEGHPREWWHWSINK